MQISLYRLFSADDVLLYVGISANPLGRFVGHKSKPQITSVRVIEVEWFDCVETAEIAEALAIRNERPLWNKVHARKARTPTETDMGEVALVVSGDVLVDRKEKLNPLSLYDGDAKKIIGQRTKAGMAAARARGKEFGRKGYITGYPKRLKAFTKLWVEGRIHKGHGPKLEEHMTAVEVIEAMRKADKKAPNFTSAQSYTNWKNKGFPTFDVEAANALEIGDI